MVNSIRLVLGFNRLIYSEGYNESENIVNILSVSSLNVTSDIFFHKWSYKKYHIFVLSECRAGLQNCARTIEPNLSSSDIKHNSYMETKLEDQRGELINLRGEELSIRFHIREAYTHKVFFILYLKI